MDIARKEMTDKEETFNRALARLESVCVDFGSVVPSAFADANDYRRSYLLAYTRVRSARDQLITVYARDVQRAGGDK